MRWKTVAIVALSIFAVSGCAKNPGATAGSNGASAEATSSAASPNVTPASDRDAIERAIRQHLSANNSLNMAAMDMTLGRISIQGTAAQADAEFRLKTGGPAMQMSYSLERHAGGWVVTKSEPSGGHFVHPPMDKNHSPAAPAAGRQAMPDVSSFMKTLPPPKQNRKTKD